MKYLLLTGFLIMYLGCSKNVLNKKIVFVGDSHVYKWNLEIYFPEFTTKNFGVPGYRINDILKDTGSVNYSDILVILVGTNDAIDYASLRKSTDTIAAEYIAMIKAFKRHCNALIIIGIPPVGKDYVNKYIGIISIHKKIKQNLISVIENTPGMYYLDSYSFLAEDDELYPNFTQDDLHLNSYGYYTLSGKLRSLLYEIFN